MAWGFLQFLLYYVTLNSKYSSKFKYVLKERNNNGDCNDIQILLALYGTVKSTFCFVLCNFVLLSFGRYKDDNPNLLNLSGDIKFEENTNSLFNFCD